MEGEEKWQGGRQVYSYRVGDDVARGTPARERRRAA
jgi:hypothetical protein